MIKFIDNEDLFKHVTEYDTILIDANIYSTMKHGLQHDIKMHYPYVLEDNIATRYADREKLGTILESKRENKQSFCLCYIMGYPNARPDLKKDILEYDALEKCLKLVNIKFKNKHIALPLMGCNKFDANGDKDKVIEIINNTLKDLDADVYTYKQKTFKEKWFDAYIKGIQILKTEGREAYNAYIKESNKNFKRTKNDKISIEARPS